MRKLAIVFPGIGYTVDKPLMHYSRRLALSLGYEVKVLPYNGFPPKIQGDTDRIMRSFEIALGQSEEMLAETDLSQYNDILFVGKSIGTIVAAKIASDSPYRNKIRLILYTPLEETFGFSFDQAIAFTGTADPWVGKNDSRIPELCEKNGIPCFVIEDGNHSLETDDPIEDIKRLKKIMKKTEKFIKQEI